MPNNGQDNRVAQEDVRFLDTITSIHGEECRKVYLDVRAKRPECSREEALEEAINRVHQNEAVAAPGRVASFRWCSR